MEITEFFPEMNADYILGAWHQTWPQFMMVPSMMGTEARGKGTGVFPLGRTRAGLETYTKGLIPTTYRALGEDMHSNDIIARTLPLKPIFCLILHKSWHYSPFSLSQVVITKKGRLFCVLWGGEILQEEMCMRKCPALCPSQIPL